MNLKDALKMIKSNASKQQQRDSNKLQRLKKKLGASCCIDDS
jgi:hypothetical protein